MIKKLLFTFLLVVSANGFAQISTFPATESFDATFTEGTDVVFIPNWTGNTVNPTATATRIFREETDYNSAPAALSVIPTSGFTGDVRVNLDMTSAQSLAVSFMAKSMLNGAGTRDVVLTMETSIDGGTNWIGTQQVLSLPNENQANFTAFSYALPAAANNQSNVWVRFYVTRGDAGTSTAAKLVIDDVNIAQSTTPQLSVDETSMTFNQVLGTPSPTHTVNVSGSNLTGDITLNATADFEISLSETTGFTNALTLTPSAGIVAETVVYVRMNAAAAGDFTGTLTISTTGVSDAVVTLSGTNTEINITYPEPLYITGSQPIFTEWDPASSMNTFPNHMAFWTHAVTDPDLTIPFTEDWHCLYNLTNRSRFFGEGENGVSFVNTGNSQYTGVCDGTDPTQATGDVIDNGRAGAIVLALSTAPTIGPESPFVLSADITWTARTILKNNRVYGLRMQYRINDGNTNLNEGWTEFPTTQEYVSGDDNTFQTFTTPLPAEAVGNEVLIRWVYYYISGTGSRAQLALDDIGISNVVLNTDELQLNNRFSFYPNPTNGNMIYFNAAADIMISDISGKQILKAENVTELNISSLSKGVYFIKNNDGKVLKMIR